MEMVGRQECDGLAAATTVEDGAAADAGANFRIGESAAKPVGSSAIGAGAPLE
jgi:hypothetical protein